MPRKAISDEQRRALRQWFKQQQSHPRQREVAQWFENKFGHRITQSTVSESLSSRFNYLDTFSEGSNITSYRQRQAQWPILEAILFDWHQKINQQGGIITGDILIEKAKQIWSQIPQYQNLNPPNFSIGWLNNFKNRHNIKQRIRHGEAASVPTNTEEEMRAIQTLCGEYNEEDIYNMDETGLYWRQIPSAGLSAENRPGAKKDKNRISIICCTNFTGTHRFALWLIGKAQRPHALQNLNTIALGCVWRANKKAWVNTTIMAEWLQAFYCSIESNRSVLLLMDNFSAHISGIEEAPPPPNIRIQWLPANSTSQYQPLDQGIIQNLKQYYKRQWLKYMIDQYEQQHNPHQTINLAFTLRWITKAWYSEIQNDTIYRCFRKAKIQPQQQSITLPVEPSLDLTSLYRSVQSAGRIQEMMSLEIFLNPIGENESLEEEQLDQQEVDLTEIIQHHTGQDIQMGGDEDGLEEEIEILSPTNQEALAAVRLLQNYKERQETSTSSDIRFLERLERSILLKIDSSMEQSTLDSWLT